MWVLTHRESLANTHMLKMVLMCLIPSLQFLDSFFFFFFSSAHSYAHIPRFEVHLSNHLKILWDSCNIYFVLYWTNI